MSFSLGHVRKLAVRFYPFDKRARMCRELVKRVQLPVVRATNAKCEVETELSPGPVPPSVVVTYEDGSIDEFRPTEEEHVVVADVLSSIAFKKQEIAVIQFTPWDKGAVTGKWDAKHAEKWSA